MSESGRLCCKSLKTPGDKFPARSRNKPRSLIDVASGSLPKSPVSLSPGDEVPRMFTRKPRLQLEKFAITVQKLATQSATSRHMQCSKFGAYSISSSAAADSPNGTSRPSAFAVLRLMTRFNLVGCWTGRSDGAFTLENTAGVDAYLMNRDDPGRRDRVADQMRLRPAAHRARAALSPSRTASKTRARARPAGTSLPPHAYRRAGSSARARAASPP